MKLDCWKTIVSFWDGFLAGAMLVSGRVTTLANVAVLNPKVVFSFFVGRFKYNGPPSPMRCDSAKKWNGDGHLWCHFQRSAPKKESKWPIWGGENARKRIPSREVTDRSHLWKRKIIVPASFKWDMLVPRRASSIIFMWPKSNADNIIWFKHI